MKKSELIKDILSILGIVGLVGVAVVAPNLLVLLKNQYPNKRYNKNQVNRSFKSIKKNGWVNKIKHENSYSYTLNKRGIEKLELFNLDDIIIPKQVPWDGKWRLVIFDIPERLRLRRKSFVNELKRLEFEQLQKSVWSIQSPCHEAVEKLTKVFRVEQFVKIVTAESIV